MAREPNNGIVLQRNLLSHVGLINCHTPPASRFASPLLRKVDQFFLDARLGDSDEVAIDRIVDVIMNS